MTPPSLARIDTRVGTAAAMTSRPLRILIVDDNHINLSVLSALLKRRFNHILDGPPVSVDSGLKAIQLLRTNVFDCILMDIQMPFLSGLETAKRIRASEDGILAANSSAHIVAVTTAVGNEPEAAYRRAGMDGMIGKPVKAHHLQHYLCPLAREAHHSAQSVPAVWIGEEHIMPPLPVASKHDRVFYLPSDAATPASRPSICEGADFEKLLRAQTLWSLKRCSSTRRARTGTVSCADRASLGVSDLTLAEESSEESGKDSGAASRSNSTSSVDTASDTTVSQVSGNKVVQLQPQSPRSSTLRISQRTLSKQIAREVAKADLGDQSDEVAVPDKDQLSKNTPSDLSMAQSTARPRYLHRISSPGWLLSDSVRIGTPDPGDDCDGFSSSPLSLALSPNDLMPPHHRPSFSTAMSNSSSGGSSDDGDNVLSFSPTPQLAYRRGSSASVDSGRSAESEQSSAVTTPFTESPSTLHQSLSSPSEYSSSAEERQAGFMDARQFCRKASSDTIQLTLPERAWHKSDALHRPTRLDEVDPSTAKESSSHTVFAQRGLDAQHAEQLATSLRNMETREM